MAVQRCRKCNNDFVHIARGRPPVVCATCRTHNTASPIELINSREMQTPEGVQNVKNVLVANGGHPRRENASEGVSLNSNSQKQDIPLIGIKEITTTPREVFRSLSPFDGLKDKVMTQFHTLGGDVNRWGRYDTIAMVEALVKTEDTLDMVYPRMNDERRAIKTIRRVMEAGLYP